MHPLPPGAAPWMARFGGVLRSVAWTLLLSGLVVLVVGSLRGGLALPEHAPELAGTDLQGQPVRLADAAKGRAAVVYFWATWCTACKLTSPSVEWFARRHRDVVVWGVAADDDDDAGQRLRTAAKDFAVVLPSAASMRSWPVRALPTTVVLDREGRVVWSRVGMVLPSELEWRVP